MSNVNIDDELKKEIENLMKEKKYRIRFQSLKGFVDNACSELLSKLKSEKNEPK